MNESQLCVVLLVLGYFVSGLIAMGLQSRRSARRIERELREMHGIDPNEDDS